MKNCQQFTSNSPMSYINTNQITFLKKFTLVLYTYCFVKQKQTKIFFIPKSLNIQGSSMFKAQGPLPNAQVQSHSSLLFSQKNLEHIWNCEGWNSLTCGKLFRLFQIYNLKNTVSQDVGLLLLLPVTLYHHCLLLLCQHKYLYSCIMSQTKNLMHLKNNLNYFSARSVL